MRIKQLLAERGISNKALAQAIGLTEMGVSKIVTGKSIPNGSTIIDIAKFLNVPCGALFDDYVSEMPKNSFVCPHCGHELKITIE